MRSTKPSQYFHEIKKLGSRNGECDDPDFSLPNHIKQNLSSQQSCEKIADFFSRISQEFLPLDRSRLPDRVKAKINQSAKQSDIPLIEPYEVHNRIKSAKKTKSTVPGDVPPRIMKEFSHLLATPAASIMNSISSQGIYPEQWKNEYGTPIPKVNPPTSEEELRVISLTMFLSKIYEWFLFQWLLPYITPHLDPGQMGSLSGCSTTHYLINLFDFIFKTGDLPTNIPHSIILAMVDYSKGFNRIDHNLVITILSDYNVPG